MQKLETLVLGGSGAPAHQCLPGVDGVSAVSKVWLLGAKPIAHGQVGVKPGKDTHPFVCKLALSLRPR